MAIAAQYDDARPFQKGFAVVAKEGQYGVINTSNTVVVPLRYDVAKIFSQDGFTILITKREYNAFWKFWQWQWWPEWSLLGGNSGPALVTKVPMAQWAVRALPGGKVLYSDARIDDKDSMGTSQYWDKGWVPSRTIPADIDIFSVGNDLAVKGAVFQRAQNGSLRELDLTVATVTHAGNLVVKQNETYYLADDNGKPLGTKRFTLQNGVSFRNSAGDKIFVSKAGDMGVAYPVIRPAIFADEKGNTFIAPNFAKPFPETIGDYRHGDIKLSGGDILEAAVSIANLAGAKYFVVVSGAGAGRGWKLYLLNRGGEWNTDIPPYRGPKKILSDGRITFEGKHDRGVLGSDFEFHTMPLMYIMPCLQHPHWYMGKDVTTGKYGIYDALHHKWQVAPKYDYLQREIAPDVAVYSVIKKGAGGIEREFYGLLDITTAQPITPSVYLSIKANGRVTRIVNDQRLSFFLDLHTGREFRSS